MPQRLPLAFLFAFTVASSAGCRLWPDYRMLWAPAAPVVFNSPPTADDIVRAVNSNSAPIRQLSSDSASVTAAGFPPLRADLAFERPRRFRMRASLVSPVLDAGSNEDLFWMWFRYSPEPGIFFARHERFATSPARQLLPLDPSLVVDSFGLLQLDPLAAYDAPRSLGSHKLEVRTRIPSPDGDMTRVLVVHDTYGWVLEQRIYDPRGQLIATAAASQHRHYPEVGVSLPHHLDVQLPAAQLNFSVNVRNFRINQLEGNPDQLWSLPQLEGYPLVDIADPRNLPPVTPASTDPAAGVGPAASPVGTGVSAPQPLSETYRSSDANYRPKYRGAW